jgi:hypothetical protein
MRNDLDISEPGVSQKKSNTSRCVGPINGIEDVVAASLGLRDT